MKCQTYTDEQENITHIHTNSIVQIKGSAERLQKRKISQKTCEKFKVYRDGDKLRFYYHDPSGIVKGAKIKTKGETKKHQWETKKKPKENQWVTNGKPEGNQSETSGKPKGNHRETNGKPTGNHWERKTNGKPKGNHWETKRK